MNNKVDTGTFIFGTLLGIVTGAALALWYAPFSGKALRGEIKARSNEAQSAIAATVNSAFPADPVAQSIEEGKAAARRRRDELSAPRS
ncbi:YtxH domain-containing protein [Anaerolineae bacterium CFX9]|jgi:gas vesicle protein|nr:YtxH domain-containing protein [Kamptonema cortianum]MDL1899542.1 YtxH domain-containing protein [Anaerolineae bacterium CFX9]